MPQLEEIQSRLIDVGSAIATPASASQAGKVTRTRYSSEHTKTLEVRHSMLGSSDAEARQVMIAMVQKPLFKCGSSSTKNSAQVGG